MGKLLGKIEQKVMLPAALASVLIMVCLTTLDAGGRYLLNNPIVGAYDITEGYLMVCCFYFGISYAYREGSNIRITFVVTRLPRYITKVLDYVIQIIAIFYCLFLLVGALKCNLPHLAEKIYLPSYTIPLGPVYILIPVGLILLILRMIFDLWQIKHGKSGLFAEGERDDSLAI